MKLFTSLLVGEVREEKFFSIKILLFKRARDFSEGIFNPSETGVENFFRKVENSREKFIFILKNFYSKITLTSRDIGSFHSSHLN